MKIHKLFTAMLLAGLVMFGAGIQTQAQPCPVLCGALCVTNNGPCAVDVILTTSCGIINVNSVAPGDMQCIYTILPCCIYAATVRPAVNSVCSVFFSVTCPVNVTCALPAPFLGVRVSSCNVTIR